ncbi:hypothetical protein EVAR_73079_1 [Eumeta japonica]|uniref:Uncharacterized protein n=1 Tax=Eumeta variegata TaxID=151549 RepID=A0A4C1SNC0_EUMVA|nr:hypothetical protein EVAR_73079_1 [Eumeta japonica]
MLDANIPWQRNYKYLGVTHDKNLHFQNHIERVRNTALFYKARLGAMLSRKSHRPKLPYSTRPPQPPPAEQEEGNRPVTVSCDILCRDDSLQASSIAHVTRRRHSHVPSGHTR